MLTTIIEGILKIVDIKSERIIIVILLGLCFYLGWTRQNDRDYYLLKTDNCQKVVDSLSARNLEITIEYEKQLYEELKAYLADKEEKFNELNTKVKKIK